MRVYGLWHGGASYYGAPSIPEDVELFDSLADAERAYAARRDRGYWVWQDFRYVNREPESVLTPVVGDDSCLWLWPADPSDDADPYPAWVVESGPRGGVRRLTG